MLSRKAKVLSQPPVKVGKITLKLSFHFKVIFAWFPSSDSIFFLEFLQTNPEKKVHLMAEKVDFSFFLLPLISGIKVKVLEAETRKLKTFTLIPKPGIMVKIFTKKIGKKKGDEPIWQYLNP